MRHPQNHVLTFALLALGATLPAVCHAQTPFTIAALPDTQFYSESTLGPGVNFFDRQASWIVSQAGNPAFNIRYVTHLGDIVDDAGPVGTPFVDQWDDAVRAMNIIRASGVPYGILPGNHDWTNAAGTGSLEHYRPRFGDTSTFFAGQPWFLGFDARGVNTASRVSTPIGDMLFISLEWNASAPAVDSSRPGATASPMAWAQGIINAHPNLPTVISTHNNINTSGVRDARGQALYDTLVRPNNQVFMVLNGHYSSSTITERLISSTNNFGRPVYELLTDYQALSRGGDGWLRLYTLDPANNRIQVRTYTPLSDATLGTPAPAEFGGAGKVQTDADSQFDLALDFATRFLPPPPPPPAPPAPAGEAFTLKQGLNGYAGTIDTEVRSAAPTTVLGAQGYMHIDLDDGTPAGPSIGLVRFDGLFGTGAQQVPADGDVLSAKLRLYVHESRSNAEGGGLDVRRLRVGFSEASTWNSFSLLQVFGGAPVTGWGARGSNGFGAMSNPDGSVGSENAGGTATVSAGQWLEFDVTRTLRAWMSGAPAHGWLIQSKIGSTNAIRLESSESELAGGRFPELVVTRTTSPVQTLTFTQGFDTSINQQNPSARADTSPTIVTDASIENNSNPAGSDQAALIRFTNLFGGSTGQVPGGARISSAVLVLNINAGVQFHDGSGFRVHRMLAPWDNTATWSSLTGGVTPDGLEAAIQPDDEVGQDVLNSTIVQAGLQHIDVTDSVRRWAAGAGNSANFGWALLPQPSATNAVILDSFEATIAGSVRPQLIVRYTQACPGDIASPGQLPASDGERTADDLIVFVNWFFAQDSRADIAGPGQIPGADAQFTADDLIVFVNRFFGPC
jgi:hypothetical protein